MLFLQKLKFHTFVSFLLLSRNQEGMSQQNILPFLAPRPGLDEADKSRDLQSQEFFSSRSDTTWILDNQKKLEKLRIDALVLDHSIRKRLERPGQEKNLQFRNSLENEYKIFEKSWKATSEKELIFHKTVPVAPGKFAAGAPPAPPKPPRVQGKKKVPAVGSLTSDAPESSSASAPARKAKKRKIAHPASAEPAPPVVEEESHVLQEIEEDEVE